MARKIIKAEELDVSKIAAKIRDRRNEVFEVIFSIEDWLRQVDIIDDFWYEDIASRTFVGVTCASVHRSVRLVWKVGRDGTPRVLRDSSTADLARVSLLIPSMLMALGASMRELEASIVAASRSLADIRSMTGVHLPKPPGQD